MSSASINGRAALSLSRSHLGLLRHLSRHRFVAFKHISVRNLTIGLEMDEGKARELYIPVPWGQIAGMFPLDSLLKRYINRCSSYLD